MKKGRHRRFEEARKLKQMGPEPFVQIGPSTPRDEDRPSGDSEDDRYAEIAARYGVTFDDDEFDDDEVE